MSSNSMTDQIEGGLPLEVVKTPILTEHPLLSFLKHFVLPRPSDESLVLQRLKLISSASNQYVRFKVINSEALPTYGSDSSDIIHNYLVYTEHEQAKINHVFDVTVNEHVYKFDLCQLFPSRSVMISETEGECRISNYSINRVINVNPQVFVDVMTQTGKLAQAAYEGTTLVAYRTATAWNLRTTSCVNANNSYYNSDKSHGQLFEEICQRTFSKTSEEMFDELAVTYPDAYLVFVLVARECQHICDHVEFTDGTEILLIHARSNYTHDEHDVKVQSLFKTPAENTVPEVLQTLETEHQFTDCFVKKQGFLVVDARGYLIRVLTGAFFFATTLIPMHNNAFETVLHCFMRGSFHRFTTMKNMSPDISKVLFNRCNATVNTVSNLLAFALTTFTKLDLHNRSYRKINGNVYSNLKKSVYLKTLPMLQTHSIKSRTGFKDFKYLSNDVATFVKSFGNTNDQFEQFLDLVCDYTDFQTDLNTCISNFNLVELEQDPLRTFVNKYDKEFAQVINTYFGGSESESEKGTQFDEPTD